MTVLFLRSSGDGFAGGGRIIYSDHNRHERGQSATNCLSLPIFLTSSTALLAEDKYPQSQPPEIIYTGTGEKKVIFFLTHSPKFRWMAPKGEWCLIREP